jgi:predicted nicotinamide N-methyase
MSWSEFQFNYQLKREVESFGSLNLTIERLKNLDETIDSLFDYLQKSGNEALLEQLCPYFGVIWPSARALTQELITHAATLKGACLLELGCGLALPSLASSILGATVTATDFHPEVPRFLERNQVLNSVQSLTYVHLDWQRQSMSGSLTTALPGAEKFEWVVGSDILYERQQPELVARVIDEWLAPKGKAVIADPCRPYLQSFVDEMTRRQFKYETHIRRVRDVPVDKDIFLLVFHRG